MHTSDPPVLMSKDLERDLLPVKEYWAPAKGTVPRCCKSPRMGADPLEELVVGLVHLLEAGSCTVGEPSPSRAQISLEILVSFLGPTLLFASQLG